MCTGSLARHASDYQLHGQNVVQAQNPLGPPIPVGICHRCQTVDGSNLPADICPVCGATADDEPIYNVVNLFEPKGFRTWYGTSRDFDGQFEWTPRGSHPKVGFRPIDMAAHANFDVWSDIDTVYVLSLIHISEPTRPY